MVDLASLERKCTRKGTEGSNPSLSSAFITYLPYIFNKSVKRLSRYPLLYLLYTLGLFFIFTTIAAQKTKENWVQVNTNNSNKIYINTTGLENFKGDDIYVWVLEENDPPITMEGIEPKIYKTKTYFLLNKHLKRYSILQIIFYDAKNNVLKSYNYDRNTDNINYKYSSPILEGSNISYVLIKCVAVINSLKK